MALDILSCNSVPLWNFVQYRYHTTFFWV
jgi:hypothetical protein